MPLLQHRRKRIRGQDVTQYLLTMPAQVVRALGWHKKRVELEVEIVDAQTVVLRVAKPDRAKRASKPSNHVQTPLF